jgi:alginate O-acetyltransferase complex protein AlgI
MVFSSLLFLFFYLPVTLAIYYLAPSRWRNLWLFIVNLVFYGWGEPVYVALMVFSIAVNYAAGYLVDLHRDKAKRILILNAVINLGLLFFFKYYDFLALNLSRLPGLGFFHPLGVTLPIGISFYTFQNMSYPIDVCRGDARSQRSFIRYGTYVALFPQLIAGPIVRYKDIADQLDSRRETKAKFASGVGRFCIGLSKKVLLANNIGALWDVYKAMDPASLSAADAWLGALAFTFQIYFDFSGYSDMAIGLGRMLGFDFVENFNYPYISRSVTEFWRRWHISLSTWFRDYVYIPLGGNRRGKGRQILNLLIVWTLTGIWHGASWNFLLWGLYYALLLVLEKVFLYDRLMRAPGWVGHIYALILVIVGWVLFSVEDLSSCILYLRSMFFGGAGLCSTTFLYYLRSFAPGIAVMILASTPLAKRLYACLPQKLSRVLNPVLVLASLLLCTAYLVDSTYNPFLYFRF